MFGRQRVLQNANPNDAGGGGGGGNNTPAPWFGDTNKDYVTGKGWKSGDDAITSYRNLETLVGADKAGRTVVLPKDDKDAEGIKAFRSKLGVPDKADGYAVHEMLKDDPLLPAVRDAALKHGVPAKMFEGFVTDVLGSLKAFDEKSHAEAKGVSEAAIAELKTKHGDQYTAKVELGKRAAQAFGLDADKLGKIEGALGTAEMMRLFIDLGAKLGEPGGGGGDNKGGGGGSGVTAAQAQEQIDLARQKRLKNEITEADYFAVLDKYGPIAAPGQRAQ